MTLLITIFAGLMIVAGIVLLLNPNTIFEFLSKNSSQVAIHVVAVISRLLVGTLLIAQSGLSRFPLAIELLGWLFISAGLFLAIMGRRNFRQLMSLVLAKFKPLGRPAGVVAMAFGGFLIFSFVQ